MRTWRNALLSAALLGAVGCGGPVAGDDDAGGADASPPDAVVPSVGPEIDGQITINEIMASNALTIVDDAGNPSDWIELYNPTDQAIPLRGYGLTDDLTAPLRAVLPAGVVLPAGGRLVLWADGSPNIGPRHLGITLAKAGGELGLSRPDGSWIDRLAFGAQETDFSAAREPDGSDLWKVEWHVSPGQANLDGGGAPMGPDVDSQPPEQVPAAGDLSEQFLGYDVMPEVTLNVPPASAASLLSQPDVWVPIDIVYQGRTYGPVAVHLKGNNSFEPFDQKPSLHIKVGGIVSSARFFGLKDLTFNNMDNDASMMHERLGYWVARAAGLPASRSNHMLLTVNGTFYGLYENVETVKKQFISRWYPDDTGSLFEATDVDFVPSDVPTWGLAAGPDDRTQLGALADALTNPDPAAAIAAAGQHANLDQFRTLWAMASVIGQFDSIPYSIPGDDIFIYEDPATGKIGFSPWGMDETMFAADFDVKNVHTVLAVQCVAVPACYQAYIDKTWDVLAMTETMGLAAERDRVAAQIAPFVALDTRKKYTTQAVYDQQQAVYWFIHERRANLAAMLPPHD